MKYCVNYLTRDKVRHLNDFDEITIRYNPSDKSLIESMQQHKDQRINIYIRDNQDFIDNDRIKFFEVLKDEYPDFNFVLKLKDYKDELTQEVYKLIVNSEKDLKYFFATNVSDFDTFWGIIGLKPTDIYIVQEMGFYAKQCAEAAHEFGIKLRAFPNVAQSAWDETPGISKFFIRPEDVKIYEDYIDVFEFYGNSSHKADVYYEIYTKKDPYWFGNLNEIIISLNEDLDSRCLLPQFAERRVSCGKRCLKGKKCQVCAVTQHLAKVLNKNNVTIKQLNKKNRSKPIKTED